MRLKCQESNWNNNATIENFEILNSNQRITDSKNFDFTKTSKYKEIVANTRTTQIQGNTDNFPTNVGNSQLYPTTERVKCDINCCDNQTIGRVLDNYQFQKYNTKHHCTLPGTEPFNLDNLNSNVQVRRGNINWIRNEDQENVESMSSTPDISEERAFELSDCETPLCNEDCFGGITNPNYPGFQHFAQTFQDGSRFDGSNYSLSKLIAKLEDNVRMDCESPENCWDLSGSENNINGKKLSDKHAPQNEGDKKCGDLELDVENNVKSVIGDFDKEIKDELSHIFCETLNFEEDLVGLRRDINDSLRKPIQKTINNISDVVNNVIRQLVKDKDLDYLYKTADGINKTAEIQTKKSDPAKLEQDVIKSSDEMVARNPINSTENETKDNCFQELLLPKLKYSSGKLHSYNRDRSKFDENCNIPIQMTQEKTIHTFKRTANKNLTNVENIETAKRTVCDQPRRGISMKRDVSERADLNLRNGFLKTAQTVRETENLDAFEVYNIETAMPVLDIDAIESHLKAAKEAERKKRTDREEIRKRLAFGLEYDEYAQSDRPGRKPSLHSRLQNGKNLQICYMNEVVPDLDNLNLDSEKNETSSCQSLNSAELTANSNRNVSKHLTRPLSVSSINKEKSAIPQGGKIRPSSLGLRSKSNSSKSLSNIDVEGKDFFTVQARLQTDARIALAQAKEKARMEMENTRRTRPSSPVALMVRSSLAKTNCRLPESRRRLSRQFLTDMNVAQLQVIVNELHTQIEILNDNLVQLLMARDDLHMTQDSRLVDIEDLTRYLEMKQLGSKGKSRSISSIIRQVN